MKLPNVEQAVVPEAKITQYLLSLTSKDGQGKAIFFMRFGFTVEAWQQLAEALLKHAENYDVAKTDVNPFGIYDVIEGELEAADGRTPYIRSVWFIPKDDDRPRLATAYPRKRKRDS